MRVLVLGGYGNFGSRICRALAGDPDIQLLVGGRNLQRAQALAGALAGGAQALAIDHGASSFTAELRHRAIELLIHTAGPFQRQAYGVAQAAAAAGAHYIDLADGRRFVCDFAAAMSRAFKAAGRSAVSGASTVPGLSSAVVDHLCKGWRQIDAIDICIAPAQTAPRGDATLAAVLDYCGEPIRVWDHGRWLTRRAWAHPERVPFARMAPRLGSLCDIPDLELFVARYAVRQRVMFRAALELPLAQRAFAVLAALRAAGVLRQPSRLARPMNRAAPFFDRWGTGLGGMVVRVEGINAVGLTAQRAWHIAADNDHGPEIPCMAAILLARRLAQGRALPIGARACMDLLSFSEFDPEFARWGMVTDIVDERSRHAA